MILKMFYGFCMAIADSVPGVSGGTIAFILGFYEKLLDSIHDVASKDKSKKEEGVKFLIKLFLGWIIGMSMSVIILSKLFETNIYILSSAFLGLTTASIPFVIFSERENIKNNYLNIIYSIIGILLVIGISVMRNYITTSSSINYSNMSLFQYLYVFFSGLIAITAMILPGISGSTILLIFGVYVPTISAVKTLLSFDFSVIGGILALGIGIICGLALSIGTIRKLLKNQKSKTLYFIIGLMIGSLYAITVGPTTLKVPKPPLSISTFNIFAFIVGISILLCLEYIRKKIEKGTANIK